MLCQFLDNMLLAPFLVCTILFDRFHDIILRCAIERPTAASFGVAHVSMKVDGSMLPPLMGCRVRYGGDVANTIRVTRPYTSPVSIMKKTTAMLQISASIP